MPLTIPVVGAYDYDLNALVKKKSNWTGTRRELNFMFLPEQSSFDLEGPASVSIRMGTPSTWTTDYREETRRIPGANWFRWWP